MDGTESYRNFINGNGWDNRRKGAGRVRGNGGGMDGEVMGILNFINMTGGGQ